MPRLIACLQCLTALLVCCVLSTPCRGQVTYLIAASCDGQPKDTVGIQYTLVDKHLSIKVLHLSGTQTDSIVQDVDTGKEFTYHLDAQHRPTTFLKKWTALAGTALKNEELYSARNELLAYSTISLEDSAWQLYRQYLVRVVPADTLEKRLIRLDESGQIRSVSTTDTTGTTLTITFEYAGDRKTRSEVWIMHQGAGLPVLKESRNYVSTAKGLPKAEVIFENGDDQCSRMILYRYPASEE